jgi:hypothetical protein
MAQHSQVNIIVFIIHYKISISFYYRKVFPEEVFDKIKKHFNEKYKGKTIFRVFFWSIILYYFY